jgi:hypothetical protein
MKTRIFLFLLYFSLFALTVVVHGATTPYATIKGNGVNFRTKSGQGGPIISVLRQGLPVAVIEQTAHWGLIGSFMPPPDMERCGLAPLIEGITMIAIPEVKGS